MKTCRMCGRELPLAEFPRRKARKDGHDTKCRDCTRTYMREYMRQYIRDNPEPHRQRALNHYHETAKLDPDRLRKIARDKFRKHHEIWLARAARYRKSAAGKASKAKYHTKRRMQMKEAGEIDINAVAALFTNTTTCCFCGVPLNDVKNHAHQKTLEHLTPLSRGGSNATCNLAISCRTCNAKKYTLTAEEFVVRLREDSAASRESP